MFCRIRHYRIRMLTNKNNYTIYCQRCVFPSQILKNFAFEFSVTSCTWSNSLCVMTMAKNLHNIILALMLSRGLETEPLPKLTAPGLPKRWWNSSMYINISVYHHFSTKVRCFVKFRVWFTWTDTLILTSLHFNLKSAASAFTTKWFWQHLEFLSHRILHIW